MQYKPAQPCLEERDRCLGDNQDCLLAGGMSVGDKPRFQKGGKKSWCEEEQQQRQDLLHEGCGNEMVWTLEVSPQLGIQWMEEEKESLGRLAKGIQSNLPATGALSPYTWPRVLGLWSR